MPTLLLALAALAIDSPHTFDGKHDIATIDLTVVYLVPKDQDGLTRLA